MRWRCSTPLERITWSTFTALHATRECSQTNADQITYLNNVVMPDDDEEDSSDEEEDDTGDIGGQSGGSDSDDAE